MWRRWGVFGRGGGAGGSSRPAFEITARKLYAEYEADDEGASAKYPGKVVSLSGVVAEAGELEGSPYVALESGGAMDLGLVSCMFLKQAAQEVTTVSQGQNIRVRGQVLGRASFAEIRLEGCRLE